MTKLKSRYKHKKCRTFCVLRAYAGLYFKRLSLKKHNNYFKLGVNEHVIITHFHDFSQTFMISFFSMNFPDLEMTILKFHDFSRFSMTVGTLNPNAAFGYRHKQRPHLLYKYKSVHTRHDCQYEYSKHSTHLLCHTGASVEL